MAESIAVRGPGRTSRLETIKREIVRRRTVGEPVNHRAIRRAVGGSPATIKKALDQLGVGTDARGASEREEELRREAQEAKAHNRALQGALREFAATAALLNDARAGLMQAIDELRGLSAAMSKEMRAAKTQSDPLDAARIRSLTDQNGKLSMRLEAALRALERGGLSIDG